MYVHVGVLGCVGVWCVCGVCACVCVRACVLCVCVLCACDSSFLYFQAQNLDIHYFLQGIFNE